MSMTGSIANAANALAALRQQPLLTAGASNAASARITNLTGSANAAFNLFTAAGSAAGGVAPGSPFSSGTLGALIDAQAQHSGFAGASGAATHPAPNSTLPDTEQMLAALLQPPGQAAQG